LTSHSTGVGQRIDYCSGDKQFYDPILLFYCGERVTRLENAKSLCDHNIRHESILLLSKPQNSP
jgi:hypothetical protein